MSDLSDGGGVSDSSDGGMGDVLQRRTEEKSEVPSWGLAYLAI